MTNINFKENFTLDDGNVVKELTNLRKCLSAGIREGAESWMAECIIGDIDEVLMQLAAEGVE